MIELASATQMNYLHLESAIPSANPPLARSAGVFVRAQSFIFHACLRAIPIKFLLGRTDEHG